ncbi:MAG TPA: 2-succinyl-5-enolpyruvyl-6-hydroxy-3-cyclohexene-1-carboxylic-acid synthase [Opitutales bacterium]|jgi:2-succinyl-5-enolpyruvyl-6-hydroxy-3-cyclohexene-1-carboxylate synthase|nr:2-succinyl-5-enolpyruvyl-6-hydroxy-3-cyclohexene-1-carboxylic-acid synthase [Opitutales bacterium]
MPTTSSIPNVNCLWGEIAAGALSRCGLRHVVMAPGSRSGPLVWGLTRTAGITAVSVLDERSAAFYALGLARASGRPVAVVCTSGTAAANFFPAVIEASMSAVPLLVLTADRPPELRDCHAGQAIDQTKIYGNYPRWQHEMALPENRVELLRYLRETMVHAWERAQGPWPGPVQVNFPFREPLAPTAQAGFAAPARVDLENILGENTADSAVFKMPNGRVPAGIKEVLSARNGVVIAGPAQPAERTAYVKAAVAWAKRRGWPVLADALSPLRHAPGLKGQVVGHYDLILRSTKHLANLTPDTVIHLGPLPTSKVLRAWLGQLRVPVLIVHDGPENVDPLHRPVHYWRGPVAQLPVWDAHPPQSDQAYAKRWRKLESAATEAISKRFSAQNALFEGKAAWLLAHKLPEGTPVFVASSMPVRDCEFFWEAGRGAQFFFNRGANGIDGTASTALGVAHALARPTVLYTGDLALLHDQNGLLAARELPPGASLTIVCINNDGGGIFEHLPMAQFDPPFERFFATPQKVDFKKFAALHNLDYHGPRSWKEFARALLPLPKSGVRLIELRTDRKRDAAFRSALFKELSEQL